MTYNSAVAKQSIFLGDAGEDQYNPILEGLPFEVRVEFSEDVHFVSGLVGANSPPATTFSLTQDETNSRIFTYSAIAGTAPFDTIDATTYLRFLFTSELTGDQTIWEKSLYIASIPTNAIQVYDNTNGWTSVNFANSPSDIPSCAQMCPIRFFNTWYNEFRKKSYGGAKYVSVYDYGTDEGDAEREYVLRQEDNEIAMQKYIYLEKHVVGTVENHDIAVKFKVNSGDTTGVEVRIKVKSLSCWGFEIKDPVTS